MFAVCNHWTMQTIRAFLLSNNMPQARFAAMAGVSRGHMSALVSGAKAPSLNLALTIERLTGGKVPVASWVPAAAIHLNPPSEDAA